jgi:hypothetical protein
MRRTRAVAGLGLIPMLLLAAACGKHGGGGGGGGSPVALDPNVPVIANLRVSMKGACTLPGNVPGGIEVLALDYTDADGNLRGGTLDDTTTAAVGGIMPFSAPIPSDGVTITGTTSGTITATFCTHFGSNSSITEQVKVTDASGKVSNELALNVPRPNGAPELPRDADPAARKSMEFKR